ncbi:MAG: peptidoglycan DD-metalloendopeptidase family protein [Gammaproteobacteria bacterium]|jgi:murein DD-endopeptidase MepM/ murein hydrolase activator NlpD|nr:peptidoglycan DD-metalloendopeptidase family protein [Gammaproteobacteria bacterium]
MNIIFVGKFRGKPLRCQLDGSRQLIICTVIISLFAVLLLSAGYWYGKTNAAVNQLAELEHDISKQKVLINKARQSAESELDALAARLGSMQANVIRLNALGQRLVKVAKLDSKEFDFKNSPSYGGPSEKESVTSIDFANVMANLNKQLSSREEQLDVLEDVIMNRQLRSESKPRGRPIVKGWTSSYYGKRTDPFTGKLAMHKGMDFAGKEGSEIIAVASGVVTWSGDRYGYGELIEINHGNGYTTRYGHNAELLVEVGDTVEKGQPISLMGSTGRSTGPHVHFEVLKNDRQVNPSKFVASR